MKNTRNLFIMLSIVILLGAAYFLAVTFNDGAPGKDEEQTPASEVIVIYETNSESLKKIGISNPDGSYALVKNVGAWLLEDNGSIEIVQSKAETLASAARYISAVDVIDENAESLGDYGLAEPQATIKIFTNDDDRVFFMGDLTPAGNYYYFMEAGTQTVYTISKSKGQTYLKRLNDYRDMTITNFDTAAVQEVEIQTKNGTLTFEYTPLPEGQEDEYGAVSVWTITSPINYKAENEKVSEGILTPLSALSASDIVSDSAADIASYGMDEAVIIRLEDGRVIRLNLARAQEAIYVNIEGEARVYSASQADFTFLNVGVMDIIQSFVALKSIDAVSSIVISTPNTEGVLTVDEGSGYYVDGFPAAEEAFKSMYQVVIGLTVDGIMAGGFDQGSWLGTVTYNMRDGSQDIISFYPYDELNVAVVHADEALFFMKKTKLTELEQMLGRLQNDPSQRVKPM